MASSVTPPRVTRAGTVSTSIQKETQEITTSKTVIEHLLNMLKTSLKVLPNKHRNKGLIQQLFYFAYL